MQDAHPGAAPGRPRRPRALLIMGRLQVGLLLCCAVALLGTFLIGWVSSGWSRPSDGGVELFAGIAALVLGGVWLAATRPAWRGRTGPLVAVAAATVPAAATAGFSVADHGALAVAFPAMVLPVAILVVEARRRRHLPGRPS